MDSEIVPRPKNLQPPTDAADTKKPAAIAEPAAKANWVAEHLGSIFWIGGLFIAMALLIVYLWTKAYFPEHMQRPKPPGHQRPPPKSQHQVTVESASDEELSRFAALADAPIEDHREPPKSALKKLGDSKNESKLETKSETKLETKLDVKHVTFDNKTAAMVSTVVDNSNFKPVERFNDKGQIIGTYTSAVDLAEAGYQIQEVLNCCGGQTPTYKDSKWRFVSLPAH